MSIVGGLSLPLSHCLRAFVSIKKLIPLMKEVRHMAEKQEPPTLIVKKGIEKNCLLEVENLFFSYDEKTTHLWVENLQIYQGDKVAIVGESGSGKTTLLKILMGLLNTHSGSVAVSGDIGFSDLEGYWKNISYIDNHTCIFPGTLRYNITFDENLKDAVSEDRYQKTVELFELKKFDQKELWQFGKNLSGGQRMKEKCFIIIAKTWYWKKTE